MNTNINIILLDSINNEKSMKVFIFMLKLYHHFKLSLTLFAYIHFTATLFTLDPAHIRFDLISASVLHDFHINADAL